MVIVFKECPESKGKSHTPEREMKDWLPFPIIDKYHPFQGQPKEYLRFTQCFPQRGW